MLGTEMINRNVLLFTNVLQELDFFPELSWIYDKKLPSGFEGATWSWKAKSNSCVTTVLVLPQIARLVSTRRRNKINHCWIRLRLGLKMLLSRYNHHLLYRNESVNATGDFSEHSCLFILFSGDFLFNNLCNSNSMELRNSSITETAPHAPAWIFHLHQCRILQLLSLPLCLLYLDGEWGDDGGVGCWDWKGEDNQWDRKHI